jgi:MFS transporter, SP family, sugar:H+ symporter
MWLAAALFLISAVGAALVDSLAALIVFRVIGGVGVGVATVVAPTCIGEIGRLGVAAASARFSS